MLFSIMDIKQRLRAGHRLILAGDENVLRQLPRGHWIGGTIPYFITQTRGGVVNREALYATDLTELVQQSDITTYDAQSVGKIYTDAPRHGFSFVIMPAASPTLAAFALRAPYLSGFGLRPLVGWVAGMHLGDLNSKKPKVFNGLTGEALEDGAVVLHGQLPRERVAEVGVVQLFEPGCGDELTFQNDSFTVTDLFVNGYENNFATYLTCYGFDTKPPLIADYYGTSVTVTIQNVDEEEKKVKLYGPVFNGIRYKLAKPMLDCGKRIQEIIAKDTSVGSGDIVFSCNCILNYLYCELKGKRTAPFYGPVTFGEIAYQLHNQALVYLKILEARN